MATLLELQQASARDYDRVVLAKELTPTTLAEFVAAYGSLRAARTAAGVPQPAANNQSLGEMIDNLRVVKASVGGRPVEEADLNAAPSTIAWRFYETRFGGPLFALAKVRQVVAGLV